MKSDETLDHRHYPSEAQIATNHASAQTWASKHHVTICPPMTCDWAISLLIPYAAMPTRRPGRPRRDS